MVLHRHVVTARSRALLPHMRSYSNDLGGPCTRDNLSAVIGSRLSTYEVSQLGLLSRRPRTFGRGFLSSPYHPAGRNLSLETDCSKRKGFTGAARLFPCIRPFRRR